MDHGRYEITKTPAASKELERLPAQQRQRVDAAIEALADNPRPRGCVKLKGTDTYRIRVGNYRVVYQILDKELLIIIVRVGDRKDIYRQ